MGAIICYDCTDERSFTSAEQWIKDFKKMANEAAPVILVANKIDLRETSEVVNSQKGQDLADKFGIKFMETSAASGHNVQATFTLLCEEILIQKYPKLYNRDSVKLQAN